MKKRIIKYRNWEEEIVYWTRKEIIKEYNSKIKIWEILIITEN